MWKSGSSHVYMYYNILLILCIIYFFFIPLAPCEHGSIHVMPNSREYSSFGRLEVCVNGTWAGICDEKWNNKKARVVCRQLGCSAFGMFVEYVLHFQVILHCVHSLWHIIVLITNFIGATR